jgi:integrase
MIQRSSWCQPIRMKARSEWRHAIRGSAQAVLDDMRQIRTGRYVFLGGCLGDSHRSQDVMRRLIGRLGYHDSLTTHGLRSSLTDWCGEETAFPAEVREMALAHTVEAAYCHGDQLKKRIALANAWVRFLNTPTPVECDNIVPTDRAVG